MGRKSNYEHDLNSIHNAMLAKMKRNTNKREAQELQTILQEIKITAKHLKDGITPKDFISQELFDQYAQLIEETAALQNQFHRGNYAAHTLFRRAHNYNQTFETGADDIFEEDLAAILATIGSKTTNKDLGNIELYLVGGKTAGAKNINLIKTLGKDYENQSIEVVNKMVELDVHPKIARLAELMKDATFSAKNYKSNSFQNGENIVKDFEEIDLHLGNTNLYRAVTGALSEIKMSESAKMEFFMRGANIYLSNKYGLADEVEKHFGDLRFIFELRGSGLLTDDGVILPVKYLIYNDPDSENIFVRDTASIILEGFEKSRNLFGSINISASRIRS